MSGLLRLHAAGDVVFFALRAGRFPFGAVLSCVLVPGCIPEHNRSDQVWYVFTRDIPPIAPHPIPSAQTRPFLFVDLFRL